MTAREAIRWVDEKLHNVYSDADKLEWLNGVESGVNQLAMRYGGEEMGEKVGMDTMLSAPAPFDQLYLRWLEAQIAFAGQEYLKYNNAMAVYNSLWTEYANWFVRNHAAAGSRFRL